MSVTFSMPGAAWGWFEGCGIVQQCDDPAWRYDDDPAIHAAAVEAGHALHARQGKRVGYGHAWVITCSPEAARVIREQAAYYPSFGHQLDAEERSELRACEKLVSRIDDVLRKAGV